MTSGRAIRSVLRMGAMLFLVYVAVVGITYFRQRSMLYFPTHDTHPTGLAPWPDGARTIGFCREAQNPRAIWLMMHGNGGQAADRDYVLPRMSEHDSLYVLEYPGYGSREGSPSRESMDRAASEAYQLLRSRHPKTPVCVLGESIGSGPACALAAEKTPPDKIVLVVPFDILANVAAQHFPYLPVRLLLRDNWNNVESLRQYAGPIEIFGAKDDGVIPIEHARALAKQIAHAHFVELPGGHNAWSESDLVKLRPPPE